MDARPRFSVVVPVHQGEAYLGEALQSLYRQPEALRQSLEVVAVDDGSTDRSPEILDDWMDRLPLRVIRREGGSNWMSATNAGLRAATGEWLGFLHQDDTWAPGRLERLDHAIHAHSDCGFFCHPVRFLGPDGRVLGGWRAPLPPSRPLSAADVLRRYCVQNFLAIPSPCFHRDLLEASGPLREDLWFLADWDFWLRLIHAAGHVVYLEEFLAGFRLHPDSQTIIRSSGEEDLRRQFADIRSRVRDLHGGRHPREVAARLNEDLTVSLANRSHGQPGTFRRCLGGFLSLGPAESLHFLRDTRLQERLPPRLRLKLSRKD